MSDSEQITLEGQAVKEILKDARRSKEIYKDFGALALQKRDVLPNKRFLNNTLVSTLRHSYRQDLKGKNGSERKYKQHMASRRRTGGRNRFRAEHDDFQREGEPENVDYGEFDAIKYSDQCTGLYIRDSRRKHAQMSDNFVEKTGKSDSESEESFTEYDDPPPPSAKEKRSPPPPAKVKRWKHDKFEAKWSDTGSADDYTSERDEHHVEDEEEAEPEIVDQKLRSEYQKYEKLRKKKIDITQPSTSRDYESYEDNEDSDELDQDEKSVKKKGKIVKEVKVSDESAKNSSASEEESNKNVLKKVVKKSKKVKKLPVAGKDLAEIISKRSMYADMEELRERGTEMGDDKHKSRGKKSRREHNAVLIEDSEAEISAKIENKSSFRRHNSPDDYVRKYPGRTAILYDDKEDSAHSSPRSSNFNERGNYRHERDGTPPRFQRGRGRSNRFHGHLGHEYRGRGRGFERGRHPRMDDRQFRQYERHSASNRSPEYHRERQETESREHSSERHKRQYSSESQSEERYSRDRLEHRSPGNGRHSEERHKRGRSRSYEKQDKKYLRGSSKDKDVREKHRQESERDEKSDFEKDDPVDISELGIPYKTVGDECKDNNMDRERHRGSEHFRESHFYGRRPYQGRGFDMRGRPFIRGRPFRGRGPFRGGFPPPMMPTMDPFYATFMQEFLKESGFEDWLKKKAKKLRRRHSDFSSSSSRSRSSRRRSRRSKRRRRRHSSSSSRSRSRSRSRSYSRRRHSSSSSRRRSYSRSHSRSYSRSRSRSKSRRDRSRSSSDKSYSRSRSRSRGRRDRSRSKTKDRKSYDKDSEHSESVEDDYQSGSKSKHKSSSLYEQSSEEENQVNEAVEEILGVKKKHKKVHKTKTKKSKPKPSKQVTNVCLESPAEGEVRVIKKKKKSKTKKGKFKKTFQEAEDIVSSVASSEMINYVADDGEVVDSELEVGEIPDENLENVSSENGVEWSSEEEGEVM